MEPVRSHRARTVLEAARLHRARERRERGLTLVEGPDLVRDVAATGARVVECFSVDPSQSLDLAIAPIPVDQRALVRLAGTSSPRGPVAVVEIPAERLEKGKDLLVAAGVSDPGNIGAMVRVAAAFGWGFAYLPGSADPWSPKAVRAGGGGQFQTPVSALDSIERLQEWVTAAAVVSGGVSPSEVPGRPIAVIIGEEAHGLDAAVIEAADHRVTIEMPGPTQSLNAAVAAGIVVHAMSAAPGHSAGGV